MKYIISSLPANGYWNESLQSFKGILFATRYDSQDIAEKIAAKLALEKNHILTVIPIFDRK